MHKIKKKIKKKEKACQVFKIIKAENIIDLMRKS